MIDGGRKAILVFAAGRGEMGLAATAALDEFGGLAYELTGVQTMVFHHVVAQHDIEHGLAFRYGAKHADQTFRDFLTYLEDQILGGCGIQREDAIDCGFF